MSDRTSQFALPFQDFAIEAIHRLATEQEAPPTRRSKSRQASATHCDYPPAPDLINMTETMTLPQDLASVQAEPGAADTLNTADTDTVVAETPVIHADRLWQDDGWIARVIKNEEDEGWAVAMFQDGESEPALVGPWTMGRDKKNPKPLDANAFGTLVKTATEVLRRHEQQLHAMLHKSMIINTRTATINVTLDIVPDEDDPYALLTALDSDDNTLATMRVSPTFKLTRVSASAWVDSGFRFVGHGAKSVE